MKRNGFFVQLCIVISILINTTSCASVSTAHQDPSIPWQEHAFLLPSANDRGSVSVWGFYKPDKDGSAAFRTINTNVVGLIPPGTQTINVRVSALEYEESRAFPMTYEFLPGQRYVIAVVKARKGLLTGTFIAEIHTVDEYRAIFAEIYPNDDGSDFKRRVLDPFEKAEAELSKKYTQ